MIKGELINVDHVKATNNRTIIKLAGSREVTIQPYVYLKSSDILEFLPSFNAYKKIYKRFVDKSTGSNKHVKVFPPYNVTQTISIPPHELRVTFRERISASDWKKAKVLEQFHYRGKGLNRIVGRRTVIIADACGYGIIGYGVLSATLAAIKPRFDLLRMDFKKQMESKMINQLVRIPRVVIHPEFRSIGLGVLITKHLIAYAREHWDINGYKPIMAEVVASMTEYHKFFEKAGFIRLGNTLGSPGNVIPKYGKGSWQSRPNHKNYNFFNDHTPKPYLIYPLTKKMHRYLESAGISPLRKMIPIKKGTIAPNTVTFKNVSATYKTHNGLTARSENVKRTFAVDSTQMYSPVLKELSLKISAGDVVLITGASGSGKSTLMKFLISQIEELRSSLDIVGEVSGINYHDTAKLDTNWNNELPLIDQVGDTIESGIALLNDVGLAEAHLYLKKPWQISDGQRYRFAIARLCDSKVKMWIADEFASTLDPLTASIVSKGLRKRAYKYGATVILAAPHSKYFLGSLIPNKLVKLRWGGIAEVFAVDCKWKFNDSEITIDIHNICSSKLTRISVGIMRSTGSIRLFQVFSELLPRKKLRANIPFTSLNDCVSVIVNCIEGVGDILYFGKG